MDRRAFGLAHNREGEGDIDLAVGVEFAVGFGKAGGVAFHQVVGITGFAVELEDNALEVGAGRVLGFDGVLSADFDGGVGAVGTRVTVPVRLGIEIWRERRRLGGGLGSQQFFPGPVGDPKAG